MSDGLIIALFFAGILGGLVVIILLALTVPTKIRQKKLIKYTGVVKGKILKIRHTGLENTGYIRVGYMVDGVEYEVKESLKLRSKLYKIGFMPIAQRKTYALGKIEVGDEVEIRYDTTDPKKSLIFGNDGRSNM